jgi:hypothetical protein
MYHYVIFLCGAAGHGLLILEVCRSHTQNDAPLSLGLFWRNDQPKKKPLPHNTQHSQEIDIHDPGGIRTYNASKLASTGLHLRPRGHRDRQYKKFHVLPTERVDMLCADLKPDAII